MKSILLFILIVHSSYYKYRFSFYFLIAFKFKYRLLETHENIVMDT